MKWQWRWINLAAFMICGLAAIFAISEQKWNVFTIDIILCIVNGILFVINKEEVKDEKRKSNIHSKVV